MLNPKYKKEIFLSHPILGEEEKQALCAVIDSEWLTMGERVAAFEKEFARMHEVEDAVAVNSCTAALHLLLIALGIGAGDEVLVPSLTFVATVNAVLYVGATPVFVDIDGLNKPLISIEDAEKKCSPKTKAVIIMHYGGFTANPNTWRVFCDAHKLFLIEDAAHAPALENVGKLSDGSAFSFFSNKNMSTAEGGMVTANDVSVLQSVRRLRAHGVTTDTLTRHRGHAFSYDVTLLGYNFRMDELRAALGLVQLSKLLEWNTKRKNLSECYRRMLSEAVPEVIVPFTLEHPTVAHLMPIVLPNRVQRLDLMNHLRENGIQSSIHYPSVHQFSLYIKRFPETRLPETEEFCKRELTLPLHPSLSENDVIYIVSTLKNFFTSAMNGAK